MTFLSTAVQNVLQEGQFCAVATTTPAGPHCTPLVYALSSGRIWLTTSRRSVKARAWRSDPAVSGLVRHGDLAVTFTGRVHPFDILDRATWSAAVAQGPQVARAGMTFSRKNARFFAGYAMDAKQVPFAWTPPGRVFVAIDIDRTALLDDEGVQEGSSRWGGDVTSHESFRMSRKGSDPLASLPADVRDAIGEEGNGALTIVGSRGPVVVPARWCVDGGALLAALPLDTIALADAGPDAAVALTIDETSQWRARDMVGTMVQGDAGIYALGRVEAGERSLKSTIRSIDPSAEALVRIAPSRHVWWHGWTSGSAEPAA